MPTALVVEDQKETAMLMKSILATRNIDVILVERATEGIALMRDTLPDVIFMDLLLPEMDGFTAIGIIKADDDLKHIPIIAITAASITDSHDRLIKAGADAFIAKPFKIPELLATVFGTVEEVQQAIDEINRVHRPATGRLENDTGDYQAGTAYNPRNPKLALWVYATLIEGALHGYETFLHPLSAEDKQAYYEDSKHSVSLLGVKPARLPATYDGLMDYMQTAVTSGEVVVGETARKIAPYILGQSRWYLKPVSYPISKMTTLLLPDPIREQYGFTINSAEASAVNLGLSITRKTVPLLPSILRHVPPYRRAQSLLKETR